MRKLESKLATLVAGVSFGVFGVRAGGASGRGHVDFRQFSVQDRGDKIRLHALAGLAVTTYSCRRCVSRAGVRRRSFLPRDW